MMDSFVLLADASLAPSRTLLQQLLACLNFTLESEDLSFWYKQKSDFYELWQQHKQLKTMEMNEAWPDTLGIYTSIQTWTHSQKGDSTSMRHSHVTHNVRFWSDFAQMFLLIRNKSEHIFFA